MLLISTTHRPATDLGYLLHKNPSRVHTSEVNFGSAHVVFPVAEEDRCEAALLVEIDPVRLVRGRDGEGGSLDQYVNDRPYVASSFVSVAISEMFSTAMSGRSKDRPQLAETPIPLQIRIPVLRCRGELALLERLFQPLGYSVDATRLPLDEQFPEWGDSPYFDVTLRGTVLLRDALRHLYLLLPTLDARKHYYMDRNEVDKLLSKGEGWLAQHPERAWIVRSFLGRKPSLLRTALEQLGNAEEQLEAEEKAVDEEFVAPEAVRRTKRSLHDRRHDRIVELVREIGPKSVIDLGCGEGRLIRKLLAIRGLDRIVGMDVGYYMLERAERRLRLEEASPRMRERVQLLHGSLMYRDARIAGFDLATVVEVVEHLDPPRLSAFERVVFEFAQPKTVLLSTPNREYNVVYDIDRRLRHDDHRFEWTRSEFLAWAEGVAERFGYKIRIEGVGDEVEGVGHPSQLAVFTR